MSPVNEKFVFNNWVDGKMHKKVAVAEISREAKAQKGEMSYCSP